MYQEMQKKLRKEEGVSEEEFLKRVVDVWEETKLQVKNFIKKKNFLMKKFLDKSLGRRSYKEEKRIE